MKWICTVCNYVHEGDAPPDVCPVCGQTKDKFEPAASAVSDDAPREAAQKGGRKWYCTVCRYIHEGDAPPDVCPVCGKPWTAFVPHVDGQEHPRGASPTAKTAGVASGADRWRCVVCNYIHEGDAPPDVCPVCGKSGDAFVPETQSPRHHHRGMSGLIEKLHLHPVSAHFPNGAMPLALVAWLAYLVSDVACLERMSFYLMLVAAAAIPVTFYSGRSDAGHRFGSTSTGVFPEKKRLSWILSAAAAVTVGWRLYLGFDYAPASFWEIGVYTGLLVVAVGLVARLGMLGGKLVFGH